MCRSVDGQSHDISLWNSLLADIQYSVYAASELVGVPLQYNLTSILKISVENNSRYKDDNGMSTIAHFIKNANFKFIQ